MAGVALAAAERFGWPLALALGVGGLVALAAAGLAGRGAARGWILQAAACLALAGGLAAALLRGGAPAPPAAVPPVRDPAPLQAAPPGEPPPAGDGRLHAFLYQEYRPLVEELGPLLDRFLREPAPPMDPAARLGELEGARRVLGALKRRLLALAPPPGARRLVARTEPVVNGLLLLAEREILWVRSGRWPAPEESGQARRFLAEGYVEPWLGELLYLTAAAAPEE